MLQRWYAQVMVDRYGDRAYTDGFEVYTTLNSKDQKIAQRAVMIGLEQYDHRQGYRGVEKNLGTHNRVWQDTLKKRISFYDLVPAVVTDVDMQSVNILLAGKGAGVIPWSGLSWARLYDSYRCAWSLSQKKQVMY